MYAKNIVILAVASLAADVLAVNVHRHGHGQVHQNQKKDMKVETEFATVTEWVTVTYDPNAPTSTANRKFEAATHSKDYSRKYSTQSSSSSSSSSVSVAAVETSSVPSVEPTPSSSSIVQVPTTLATLTKPVEAVKVAPTIDIAVAAPTTSAAPAPASSSPEAAVPAPSGGNKRMLAYNDPGLLSGFLGTNSKVGAKYNWGQVDDSASQAAVPFAPMLWSPAHADTWQSNADKAIAAGAKALLSFNEPDNAGQANMDPASAAAAHIKYMNPYKGKIPISTPAITNSNNAGEGISWLKAFISACNGQCAFDFIACHWYSDYNDLLQHLKDVHVAGGGLPVWLTEFAPIGGSIDPNSFVAEITHELDTNPDYSFVEQYAYFMVSDGTLTSGGQPNTLGQTFAFSS
jgi:hypothetical protein